MVRTRGAAKVNEQNKHSVEEDREPHSGKKQRAGKEESDEQKPSKKHPIKAKSVKDDNSFTVPFEDKQITCDRHGQAFKPSCIFTHGAGGDISTPAISEFAKGFAEVAPVVLFNGSMNLKNRVKAFCTVAEHLGFDHALGGRSMGARASCLTAVEEGRSPKALVLVSFPLVADKNKESREQVLVDLPEGMDVLFISGTKDSMCDLEHLQTVVEKMEARAWIMKVEGADHGMSWKPTASVDEMRRRTGKLAAEWLQDHDASTLHSSLSWDTELEAIHYSGWTAGIVTVNAIHDADQTKEEQEAPPPAKRRKRGKV